jgi:4-amino-4-deoxy-L-arabinose transferase-like glycosyltransferase
VTCRDTRAHANTVAKAGMIGQPLQMAESVTTAQRADWHDSVAIAAVIVLALAATAWMRPLMLPDEGRYVGVAWEMMRSGDWLVPTLNGLPFFHKPPLFYWITAGSMSLFGLHEEAARAAPLFGASLGAFSFYLFIRRWSGQRAARLALVALLAQPLFYLGGQFANLDMLVAGCITATVVLLAHAALCLDRGLPYHRALAGAYAVAALGVLAKGLIGFVIPALVVATWLLARGRGRALFALVWWPGVLLFGLLAAPWFVAMQLRFPDFLDYFFVVQHFQRFVAGGFNNEQPFWFYPAVVLLISLPWMPWLVGAFRRKDTRGLERDPVHLLMGLWILTVVVFFSMPKSKLLGYILPAVPPLAYLVADGFLRLGAPSPRAKRLWFASAGLAVVLSVGANIWLALHTPRSSRELASTLGTQRALHEPVFMLDGYYYDVPLYAKLFRPIRVVDDWANTDLQNHDNWRKELAEAGHFSAARAARALITPSSFRAAVCAAPVSWVIGPATASAQYPFLVASRVAFNARDTMLWRVDTGEPGVVRALGCQGKPTAGSAEE